MDSPEQVYVVIDTYPECRRLVVIFRTNEAASEYIAERGDFAGFYHVEEWTLDVPNE